MIFDDEGHLKDVLVEFDKETNEFIVTDTEKVQARNKVTTSRSRPNKKNAIGKGKRLSFQTVPNSSFRLPPLKGCDPTGYN